MSKGFEINDAIKAGLEKFDQLVENGSLRAESKGDAAIVIKVSIQEAGFRIVRAPKSKTVEGV